LYLLFLICSYVDSERVTSSLFPENGSFVKLREGCFALLILSKWKISQSERGLFCIVDS